MITAGAAEANYLALKQLLNAGDEIAIETPGWPQADAIAKAKGAKIVPVKRDEAADWHLPLEALEADVSPKTREIFFE